MIRIKVCGITREKDARAAVEFGADALGFIFYPKSPRAIEPERAAEIIRALPPFVTPVGVFVDEPPEAVRRIYEIAGLNAVQLHGSEPPEAMAQYPGQVIKGFRVRGPETLADLPRYKVSALLLDTYKKGVLGGTGETFDWSLAVEARQYGRIVLSGGLNPENVADAVRGVRPYAIDVSSGIEVEPGIKDHGRMKRLIQNARSAMDS